MHFSFKVQTQQHVLSKAMPCGTENNWRNSFLSFLYLLGLPTGHLYTPPLRRIRPPKKVNNNTEGLVECDIRALLDVKMSYGMVQLVG